MTDCTHPVDDFMPCAICEPELHRDAQEQAPPRAGKTPSDRTLRRMQEGFRATMKDPCSCENAAEAIDCKRLAECRAAFAAYPGRNP